MKVEINLGKLLNFYDSYAGEYDLDSGDGFRAFMLDYICGYEKEQSEDWADNHTDYTERHFVFGDILFKSHDQAELVLQKMKERIKTKGFVTVADYYMLSNQSCAIQSDYYNWGWRDMNGAYAFSWIDHGNLVHGLKLPNPMRIEHFRG